MERFNSIEEILSSNFSFEAKPKTDRVLKSTRIEKAIFDDLRDDAPMLDTFEQQGKQKLRSFGSLIEDVFQSVYGLNPRYTEESELSSVSREFNKGILAELMADDNYSAVKSVCEGKELPAIGATEEFTQSLVGNLSSLMNKATSGKGQVGGLDLMEQDKEELM